MLAELRGLVKLLKKILPKKLLHQIEEGCLEGTVWGWR